MGSVLSSRALQQLLLRKSMNTTCLVLSRSGMKHTLFFWGSFVIFRRSKGSLYVKLLIQHKLFFFFVRLPMSFFFHLNVVVKRRVLVLATLK